MRNQIEIEICNVRSLEIWRPKRQQLNYAPTRYMLDRITPSSARRLIRVVKSMEWDYRYHESWFESGYGYDFNEYSTFSYPATKSTTDAERDLAIWLTHLLFDIVHR